MKIFRLRFFILTTFVFSISLLAREPQKGYRGFVDANADFSFNKDYSGSDVLTYYGVSTSHGYQLNSHYFLGAGLMFEKTTPLFHSIFQVPVYVHARTDWTFGRLPLYGDVRIGGVVLGEYRFYFSPTVGYRLNLGRKTNFNFGLGMNFRGYGWSDEKTLHPQLAVRAGFDF